MTLDSLLDRLESRRVRIGAVVLLVAVSFVLWSRRESLDYRMGRVCASLYRSARTAADSAAIDTARTALRSWRNQVVVPAETCGDLRRARPAR